MHFFITPNRLRNSVFLRADCADDLAGEKSHRYCPSTGNQRIEAWWAYLRRSRLTWWINFFKDLVDHGQGRS